MGAWSKEDLKVINDLLDRASDINEGPLVRISSCRDALAKIGPTTRVERISRQVIRHHKSYFSSAVGMQLKVRMEAEHLAAELERAIEIRESTNAKEKAAAKEFRKAAKAQAIATVGVVELILNYDLLPPDEEDLQYWDYREADGFTPRQLFTIDWRISDDLKRTDIVHAILADPEKISGHVSRLMLWDFSKERLTEKWVNDRAEILQLILENNLENNAEGVQKLVEIIESSGPLFEFRLRPGSRIPVLCRSKTGQILDKIDFITHSLRDSPVLPSYRLVPGGSL